MNFVEAYVQYAEQFTDSPPILHHRVALSVLSTVINRNVWLSQGHKKIYPNLWMLIIAPSSFYRKSYTLSIGEDLVREIDTSLVLPREFSHEKLIESLQEQPHGMLIFYEFKTFMGLMERDYMSGTKSLITELYDCPLLYDRKTIKGGTTSIREPFLNILAASTMDWFVSSIKDDDMAGGFLPRFLIVTAPKKDKILPFQPPANMSLRHGLVESLKSICEVQGEMKFEPKAIDFYTDWYINFEKKWNDDPQLTPFYARLTEYAKKLAMIMAIDNHRSLTIKESDCRLACALADTFSRAISSTMEEQAGMSNGYLKRRKVVKAIQNCRGEGIQKSNLLRSCKISVKELDPILTDLEQEEKIVAKDESFTDGLGRARVRKVYISMEGPWAVSRI